MPASLATLAIDEADRPSLWNRRAAASTNLSLLIAAFVTALVAFFIGRH